MGFEAQKQREQEEKQSAWRAQKRREEEEIKRTALEEERQRKAEEEERKQNEFIQAVAAYAVKVQQSKIECMCEIREGVPQLIGLRVKENEKIEKESFKPPITVPTKIEYPSGWRDDGWIYAG